MTSMSVGASNPFTVHDLEGMPDDGRRYELIDGELLVSPAPGLRHQTVGLRLYRLLDDACPDDLYVVAAPFAVQTDVSNEVQPDVLVARFDELTDKNLPTAPVLAVEVLSPSGRLIDLNLKRAAYQRMGTPSYWVLDPDVPDLLVLELDADGRYEQVARVAGNEVFEAHLPFKVRIVPMELLGRLRGSRT
jgi:Uma2 family endonuclease